VKPVVPLFLGLLLLLVATGGSAAPLASGTGSTRLVVLGDPHLPGNRPEAKARVLQDINGWEDVARVVVVGDLCQTTGTEREYTFARDFFRELVKPLSLVGGNHDYVFSDAAFASEGVFRLATPAERSRKLDRFMRTFGRQELSSTLDLAGYHLVFLTIDSLDGQTFARISEERLKWLEWTLYENRQRPTLVFTHAPLWPPQVTASDPKLQHYVSQPQDRLLALIQKNPQVVLWVAGHVHLGALNPVAIGPANRIGATTVINNGDLDGRSLLNGTAPPLQPHTTIWSTSLYLHPDKIAVRVYDHTAGAWLPQLDREFPVLQK